MTSNDLKSISFRKSELYDEADLSLKATSLGIGNNQKNPMSVEKIDEDFEFDMTDMNYDNDGYLYSHKVVRKSDLNLN